MRTRLEIVVIPMLLAVVASAALTSTHTANHDSRPPGSNSTQIPGVAFYQGGDADFSGRIDLADLVYLVNYMFRRGEPPRPFYLLGDVNCDGTVAFIDIIRLVNYLYREGDYRQGNLCEFMAAFYLDSTGYDEAALMALWYAGELAAPPNLTDRFRDDLRRIRTELWSIQPNLDGIFYTVPWQPSLINLGADSITAIAIRDSVYDAWDALNSQFGLDSIRERFDFGATVYYALWFDGLKNPEVIAEAYEPLPGILYSYPPGHAGQDPNGVWPYRTGDTVTYVFMIGWGDCLSGCSNKRFYYVAATPDSVWYVGHWLRVPGQVTTPPAWWPEACENLSRTYLDFLCP